MENGERRGGGVTLWGGEAAREGIGDTISKPISISPT